jgi:hypothetical protein
MDIQRFWLKVAAFLILVWGALGVVMWATEDSVFTPEKTLLLMAESPWFEDERLGHEQRMQYLDKVITSVVRLSFSQRNTMRDDGQETIERFFKSLSDDERKEYVSRVVKENFKAVMKGVDKLPVEERRRIITGIHRELKKKAASNPEMQLLLDQDSAQFEKNFNKEMTAFFEMAPPSAKIEMGSMLEAFQARMQGMRR